MELNEQSKEYLAGQIKGLATEVLKRNQQCKTYIAEKLGRIAKELGFELAEYQEVCAGCGSSDEFQQELDDYNPITDEPIYKGTPACPQCDGTEKEKRLIKVYHR